MSAALGLGVRPSTSGGRPAARPAPLPALVPAPAFTGAPGSGFAALPLDPVRTTAKPACRLLVPPRQRFTGRLTVGVYAGANDGGSLFDTMGLAKVTFHYEGTSVDVTEPRVHSFRDANGKSVHYFGYWAELANNGTHGEALLYIEAVPRDATMQARVIGPYSVFPAPSAHDLVLDIRADGSGDFTSIAAASHAKAQGAGHPLLRITQGGSYELGAVAGTYAPQGYCTIEASAPVVISTDAAAFDGGSFVRFRPFIEFLRLRGENITVDFANAHELELLTGCWFDGCRFTQSRGAYALWRKTTRTFLGWLIRGSHYFTECTFTHTYNSLDKCLLARGNVVRECWADIFNDAFCMVGNRVLGHDSRAYVDQIAALEVAYMGLEAGASIAISSNNLLTITYGAVTETLQINTTQAAFLAHDAYSVADVAAWLNTRPGWQASVLDDSRAAQALGVDGGKGLSFAPRSVGPVPLRLYTSFDIHADWCQVSTAATLENIVVADNIGIDLVTQNLFLPGQLLADVLVLNNAFHNKTDAPNSSDLGSAVSGARSHFVVAHNTMATQVLRINSAGLSVDPYCLVANNSLRALIWQNGPSPALAMANNHVHAVEAGKSADTASTAGGDAMTLYADAAAGDFAPRGDLLATPVPAVVRTAQGRRKRGALAAKGAVAA
ncbi:hypothetical protein [Erythrobacter sp. EC-HK427]|uniref:hypothetical protein n=1 Tax=Erythrobacter sp. EC-HK427 TaxID=2038396 RepID=UPI001257F78A|nr:hypothetical protein [Erythrobacter sp. EC-HK427]VVT02328.1 conserved hypothetical protein [Erythrobacter sp. EC-HK427]